MWFWLAITSGFFSALSKVVTRMALKDQESTVIYSFLFIFLMSLLFLPFSLPFDTKILSDRNLLFIIALQGLFWSLTTVFSFASQARTDVSLSMIVSRSRILWMIPLGFLFLGESPSFFSVIGMITIFLGLALLFYKGSFHNHRGVQFMALASICGAVGTIFTTVLVRGPLTSAQVAFVSAISQAFIIFILMLWRKNNLKKIKAFLKRSGYLLILATILDALGFFQLNNALKVGVASSANAIHLSMTVLTIFAGVIFLKERQHLKKKIISSLMVTVGIIMVKVFS